MTAALRLTALSLLALLAATRADAQGLRLTGTITVPGKPLESFDASFVDPAKGLYFLADRSNGALDVVNVRSRKLVAQIGGFVGAVDRGPKSGPDGVITIPGRDEVWVGDGDSTVKIVSLANGANRIIATISTGGAKRVDGLAYDAKHGLVLAVNNADEPPFLSLISVADRRVLARIEVPQATDGVEQPVFMPETGLFYFSVPAFGETKNRGAIGVFDPVARRITRWFENDNCLPAGVAHGPGTKLILGCDAGSEETHLPPLTLIVDVSNGSQTAITQVGSSDQVWYSPGVQTYYVAARGMPGGPVLGVIDARTERWVQNVPTAPRAYSVAADSETYTVFMPLPPNPVCAEGCIGVFSGARSPQGSFGDPPASSR